MSLRFKVQSEPVIHLFRGLPRKFVTRGKIVMGRNAGIIQRRVEDTAPRDLEFMAEHVEIVRIDDGLGFEVGWYADVFLTESESRQFYPPHVEAGTLWTPAQPSLGPAFNKQQPVVIRGIERILEDLAEGR